MYTENEQKEAGVEENVSLDNTTFNIWGTYILGKPQNVFFN